MPTLAHTAGRRRPRRARRRARALLEAQPRTPAKLGAGARRDLARPRTGRASHTPPAPCSTRADAAARAVGPQRRHHADHRADRGSAPDWRRRRSWDDVALRYLGAFGPATAADLVAWSRVPGPGRGLRAAAAAPDRAARRGRSRTVRPARRAAPAGRRPRAAAVPARLRQRAALGHADRTHVFPDDVRARITRPTASLPGTVLVDGAVAASWTLERSGTAARLLVHPLRLPRAARPAVRGEALGLLGLLAPDARAAVEFGADPSAG